MNKAKADSGSRVECSEAVSAGFCAVAVASAVAADNSGAFGVPDK